MCEIINILTAVWLIIISTEDIKTKQVTIWKILIIMVMSVIYVVIADDLNVIDIISGISIGIIIIGISFISKQALGLADALLITCLSIRFDINSAMLFVLASFASSSIIGIELYLKRKDIKFDMPFVPFITLSYIGIEVINYVTS